MDFLLATKRAELRAFLAADPAGEEPAVRLERALGVSLEQLEKDLEHWVRLEY